MTRSRFYGKYPVFSKKYRIHKQLLKEVIELRRSGVMKDAPSNLEILEHTRTPTEDVLKAANKLDNTEDRLEETRQYQKRRKIVLKKKWKLLETLENSFRETFLAFNTFVSSNKEKRERALISLQDHRNQLVSRRADIMGLEEKLVFMREVKLLMDEKMSAVIKFDIFLNKVLEISNEFKAVKDIINRYNLLQESRANTITKNQEQMDEIECVQTNFARLIDESTTKAISLQQLTTRLTSAYESARRTSQRWENIVLKIRDRCYLLQEQLQQVKDTVWLIYNCIIDRQIGIIEKHTGMEIPKKNVTDQIKFIKSYFKESSIVCYLASHGIATVLPHQIDEFFKHDTMSRTTTHKSRLAINVEETDTDVVAMTSNSSGSS